MKLTNAQLYAAHLAIQKLVSMTTLSTRTSYKVAKLAIAVEAAIAPAEATRSKILESGVKKDDEGNPLPVLDDAGNVLEGQVRLTEEGGEQLRELMAIEVEVDAVPIALDELTGEIAPTVFIGLGPLVVDEPNAEAA